MNSPQPAADASAQRSRFRGLLGLTLIAGLMGAAMPSSAALPVDYGYRPTIKRHGKPGKGTGPRPRAMYRHWEGYAPYAPKPRFDRDGFLTGGSKSLRTSYRCHTHECKGVA